MANTMRHDRASECEQQIDMDVGLDEQSIIQRVVEQEKCDYLCSYDEDDKVARHASVYRYRV